MTKIRILPLRAVVIDGVLAAEGHKVDVDPDVATSLIAEATAEPASVLAAVPALEG